MQQYPSSALPSQPPGGAELAAPGRQERRRRWGAGMQSLHTASPPLKPPLRALVGVAGPGAANTPLASATAPSPRRRRGAGRGRRCCCCREMGTVLSPAWCVPTAPGVLSWGERRVPRAAPRPSLPAQPRPGGRLQLRAGHGSHASRAAQTCCVTPARCPPASTFSGGIPPAWVTAKATGQGSRNAGRAGTRRAGSPAPSCLRLSQLAEPSQDAASPHRNPLGCPFR